jgi:hypothetical protein
MMATTCADLPLIDRKRREQHRGVVAPQRMEVQRPRVDQERLRLEAGGGFNNSQEAVRPVWLIECEAANARAIPAHHHPIAVMFDFVDQSGPEGGRVTFDGRHGLMKPEGRRTIMGGCDAPSMRAKYKTAQTMMIAVTIKPLPFTKAFSTVVTERGSGGHDKAGRYHSQPHTCPLASTCECLAHMYSCPYQVAVGG